MGMEPVSQVTMTSTMMKSYASRMVILSKYKKTVSQQGFHTKTFQPMPVLPADSPPPTSRSQSDQLVTLLAASQHAGSSPPAGTFVGGRNLRIFER